MEIEAPFKEIVEEIKDMVRDSSFVTSVEMRYGMPWNKVTDFSIRKLIRETTSACPR